MWQKCPVCNASGILPCDDRPLSVSVTCPTCGGRRIISTLTGLPPGYAVPPDPPIRVISAKDLIERTTFTVEDLMQK